jgi:polyphosphate kinase
MKNNNNVFYLFPSQLGDATAVLLKYDAVWTDVQLQVLQKKFSDSMFRLVSRPPRIRRQDTLPNLQDLCTNFRLQIPKGSCSQTSSAYVLPSIENKFRTSINKLRMNQQNCKTFFIGTPKRFVLKTNCKFTTNIQNICYFKYNDA